jgi:hypothetical protein
VRRLLRAARRRPRSRAPRVRPPPLRCLRARRRGGRGAAGRGRGARGPGRRGLPPHPLPLLPVLPRANSRLRARAPAPLGLPLPGGGVNTAPPRPVAADAAPLARPLVCGRAPLVCLHERTTPTHAQGGAAAPRRRKPHHPPCARPRRPRAATKPNRRRATGASLPGGARRRPHLRERRWSANALRPPKVEALLAGPASAGLALLPPTHPPPRPFAQWCCPSSALEAPAPLPLASVVLSPLPRPPCPSLFVPGPFARPQWCLIHASQEEPAKIPLLALKHCPAAPRSPQLLLPLVAAPRLSPPHARRLATRALRQLRAGPLIWPIPDLAPPQTLIAPPNLTTSCLPGVSSAAAALHSLLPCCLLLLTHACVAPHACVRRRCFAAASRPPLLAQPPPLPTRLPDRASCPRPGTPQPPMCMCETPHPQPLPPCCLFASPRSAPAVCKRREALLTTERKAQEKTKDVREPPCSGAPPTHTHACTSVPAGAAGVLRPELTQARAPLIVCLPLLRGGATFRHRTFHACFPPQRRASLPAAAPCAAGMALAQNARAPLPACCHQPARARGWALCPGRVRSGRLAWRPPPPRQPGPGRCDFQESMPPGVDLTQPLPVLHCTFARPQDRSPAHLTPDTHTHAHSQLLRWRGPPPRAGPTGPPRRGWPLLHDRAPARRRPRMRPRGQASVWPPAATPLIRAAP